VGSGIPPWKEIRMAASVFAAPHAASRPAQGAMAGINITPLVDVMLAPNAVLSLDSSGEAEYRAFALALAAARQAGYANIAIRR